MIGKNPESRDNAAAGKKGSFQDQQKIHEINVLGGLPGCVGGF